MLYEPCYVLHATCYPLNYVRYEAVNRSTLGFVIAQMMELLFQVLRYHYYFLYKQR